MLRNRLSHFVFALAVCVCALLCPSAHAAGQLPERWLPVDEAGWTVLRAAPDSRIIYVSSSAGDDAAGRACSASDAAVGGDPFRPAGPISAYKTVRAGLSQARDGYPDWVLLRRGDAWEEPLGTPHNGRSAAEPAVIGAWGQGRRPQLRLRGKQNGLRFDIHGGFHDIAVAGIEFYAPGKDPESPEFTRDCRAKSGVSVFISNRRNPEGRRLLIEDCCLRYCGATFMVGRGERTEPGDPVEQIVFRRNLVLGSYSRTSHSQGTYAARMTILLEENIYDHNGWLIQEKGNRKQNGGATIFNHNTYFCDCHDVLFRGNMFLRASSIGNKWTANSGPASARNIAMDNNLYVEGEIGISAGGNKPGPLRFKDMAITNNVMLDIGRGRPTLRHLGWGIGVTDWDGGTVAGNVVILHEMDEVHNVYALNVGASDEGGQCRNVAIRDNLTCGAPVLFTRNPGRLHGMTFARNMLLMPWRERPLVRLAGSLPDCRFSGNRYWSGNPEGGWFSIEQERLPPQEWMATTGDRDSTVLTQPGPVPEVSVETYMEHLGLEPTMEAFIAHARRQSKANWRQEFTAAAFNKWVRRALGYDQTRPARADHRRSIEVIARR